MTVDPKPAHPQDTESEAPEGFIGRWSQRKLEARSVENPPQENPAAGDQANRDETASESQASDLTDADMPPVDSLDENSDFSGFMSPKVSEELRQIALRKLFSLPQFNVSDGLDDYNEDFTSFAKLGSIVTHDMRRALKREEERLAREAERAPSDEVAALEGELEEEEEQPPVSNELAETPEPDDGEKAEDLDDSKV